MAWKYRPAGRKNWYIGCITPGGYELRFSARTSDERAAEIIRAKVEVEQAEGRFLDRKRRSRWTLGQLMSVYLAHMEVKRPRSAAWRRDRFAQLVRGFGNIPLEEITVAALDAYVARRLHAGKSFATVKEDAAILRHALRMAAQEWHDETGLSEYRLAAWRPPDPPHQPDRKAKPVPSDAWKRILAAARKRGASGRWADVQGLAALLLTRTTGARLGEAMRLRREDVDLKAGIVRRQILKRRSPVVEETRIWGEPLTWLRKAAKLHDHPLIFANPESGKPRKNVRAFWQAVLKDAKVNARMHGIRHAYGRDYLEAGHSLRELQDRLGHSSIRTTEIYAHLVPKRRVERGLAVE